MRGFWLCAVLFCVASCKKTTDAFVVAPPANTAGFVQYTIPAGAHFTTTNAYQAIAFSELRFKVRFDSSAIYKTIDPQNQYDINKLYGFSDNGSDHHQYSARFGWRWSAGALRLFAYVYNEGKITSEEVCTAPLGVVLHCTIAVQGDGYRFSCGEATRRLPRKSKTANAVGYKLYPYFGGDETAPHAVTIWIAED